MIRDAARTCRCRRRATGHAHAVEALVNAGAKLEDVRLSQTKGSAVRAMVIAAYRRMGKPDDDDEAAAAVGRDRKQVKSNAFLGPGARRSAARSNARS